MFFASFFESHSNWFKLNLDIFFWRWPFFFWGEGFQILAFFWVWEVFQARFSRCSCFFFSEKLLPSLKLTFSHPENGWFEHYFPFWGPAYLQGSKMLVSGSVCEPVPDRTVLGLMNLFFGTICPTVATAPLIYKILWCLCKGWRLVEGHFYHLKSPFLLNTKLSLLLKPRACKGVLVPHAKQPRPGEGAKKGGWSMGCCFHCGPLQLFNQLSCWLSITQASSVRNI